MTANWKRNEIKLLETRITVMKLKTQWVRKNMSWSLKKKSQWMSLTEDWIKLKRKLMNWKTVRKTYQRNRQKPQRREGK